MALPDLNLIDEPKGLRELISQSIRELSERAGHLEILEAGCGRQWPFRMKDANYKLTGVDTDQEALETRQKRKKDLDVGILGDLREVEFDADQFDVIYSNFVLEHIQGAEAVLENFRKWLKPGGLMILTFPDRYSVYGFITRISPFWFHVWYKRYLNGEKNAGKEGFGPYPTYHDPVIGREAFRQYAEQHGLELVEEYGFGTLPAIQTLFTRLVQLVSFGQLASRHKDLLYILRQPG